MQQRSLRTGKRARHWCRRQCFLLTAIILVGAVIVLLRPGGGPSVADMSVRGTAWARSGDRNAAFCSSRLRPRLSLPAPPPSTVASLYNLADALTAKGAVLDEANATRAQRIAAVYDVSVGIGSLRIPTAFEVTALRMFPAHTSAGEMERLARLERQSIVTVLNRYTRDMAYFNDIRRLRPGAEAVLTREDEAAITHIYSTGATPQECDFCSVERTAMDVFGRKSGPAAYTAANVAKMSPWHSIVVARRHNPMTYDVATIEDIINQSAAWFDAVAQHDAAQQFGNGICDIGKRASASQAHLHFQVWTTTTQFASGFARLHAAAQAFEAEHDASYWVALIEAHAAAGLVLRVGSAYVFPHLTPAKEREVIVLEPTRTTSFGQAVGLAMVALRDEGQVRSMSIGMALPRAPAGVTVDMPAILRMIDRGNPLDPRGDTGAFEYFTSPYIGTDPYRVMGWLQRTAAKLNL